MINREDALVATVIHMIDQLRAANSCIQALLDEADASTEVTKVVWAYLAGLDELEPKLALLREGLDVCSLPGVITINLN